VDPGARYSRLVCRCGSCSPSRTPCGYVKSLLKGYNYYETYWGSLGNVPQKLKKLVIKTLIFVERYLVTLLISLSYCEYVPSSAITNIPFYYYMCGECSQPIVSLVHVFSRKTGVAGDNDNWLNLESECSDVTCKLKRGWGEPGLT
jgi:hypothetical protein